FRLSHRCVLKTHPGYRCTTRLQDGGFNPVFMRCGVCCCCHSWLLLPVSGPGKIGDISNKVKNAMSPERYWCSGALYGRRSAQPEIHGMIRSVYFRVVFLY